MVYTGRKIILKLQGRMKTENMRLKWELKGICMRAKIYIRLARGVQRENGTYADSLE